MAVKYPDFPYPVTITGNWSAMKEYMSARGLANRFDYLAGTGGPGRIWTPQDPCFTIYFADKAQALWFKLSWQNA